MNSILSTTDKLAGRLWPIDSLVSTVATRVLPESLAIADLPCCNQQCWWNGNNYYGCYNQCVGCECGCGPCFGFGGYNTYCACRPDLCSSDIVCKIWTGYCCF
jgi:hypothetical protein